MDINVREKIIEPKNDCVSGNCYFTDYNDNTTKVEYTMGLVPDKNGTYKINLHHSSFPYLKNENS